MLVSDFFKKFVHPAVREADAKECMVSGYPRPHQIAKPEATGGPLG